MRLKIFPRMLTGVLLVSSTHDPSPHGPAAVGAPRGARGRFSCNLERGPPKKKPRSSGLFSGNEPDYFSFVSLYSSCLRAFGSNFMIDIFSGIVFLFLLVV